MIKKMKQTLIAVLVIAGVMSTGSCAKKQMSAGMEQPRPPAQNQESINQDQPNPSGQTIEAKPISDSVKKDDAFEKQMLRKEKESREQFQMQHIHFKYDSAQLTASAKSLIKEKMQWLKDNPDVSVIIEGHCDQRGTTSYNLALGERRASSVRQYLTDLGIKQTRMTSVSFGEERPLNPEQTPDAWHMNRRVQFKIKDLEG